MRSIAFQFARLEQLARALDEGDFELDLPPGENVVDGEWILVLFECAGCHGTAAAGKAILRGDRATLRFTERDWERLEKLARSEAAQADTSPRPLSAPRRGRSSPSAPTVSAASQLPDRISGVGARVLVVDDEQLVRDMLGAMLEGVGLLVETVADAEEALQRLHERRFDLLLVDWHLPGMSGLDLCRAVRKDAKLRKLPVLFLTSSSSSRDMVDAFAAGADDYMMKPFRAPELGARIFGLLRRAMSMSLTG